jgi:transcriptional regulator with XRE-family HTH domain
MLGSALRCIRVFHDLKQGEAATKLGISRSYLSEIESGAKEATLQLVQRYAEVFGLPASSILFFSENLGRPSAHADARRFVAGKILALMRFLEARAEKETADAE